jgi:hypothetical protein
MTWKDWDEDIDSQSVEDLEKCRAALEVLQAWPAFNRAFKGYHLFLLISFIDYGFMRRRNKERAKISA